MLDLLCKLSLLEVALCHLCTVRRLLRPRFNMKGLCGGGPGIWVISRVSEDVGGAFYI